MTTQFDPETGVLRLGHAALAVLARLAVAPTDPSLTDHATAPPLAALRRAGILGPGGIDPAVRPLAEVLGAPRATLELVVDDARSSQRCRGWATASLLVIGVPAPGEHDSYDLMADVPAQAGSMIGELVGLAAAPPSGGAPVTLSRNELAAVLAGSPVPALPTPGGHGASRWQLDVSGGADGSLQALDAGPTGHWLVHAGDLEHVTLVPTDPARLRGRIDDLLAAALA